MNEDTRTLSAALTTFAKRLKLEGKPLTKDQARRQAIEAAECIPGFAHADIGRAVKAAERAGVLQ